MCNEQPYLSVSHWGLFRNPDYKAPSEVPPAEVNPNHAFHNNVTWYEQIRREFKPHTFTVLA